MSLLKRLYDLFMVKNTDTGNKSNLSMSNDWMSRNQIKFSQNSNSASLSKKR